MDHKSLTLEQLSKHGAEISHKNALVGFDGFVDRITSVVDKRFGQGEDFERMETIEVFGNRILSAAGKSTNIELYVNYEKLGGNGPIMANALLNAGLNTRYIGALGEQNIHPVFEEFAKNTDAISVVDPGITHALEFTDGKIMLGTMTSLDALTYDAILKQLREGEFFDLLSRQDLISIVNWTMIPNMTALLGDLLDRVLPNLPPRDTKHFFFDLADPVKRPLDEIETVLRTISRFQNHGSVTFGLNLAEAKQVFKILGRSEIEVDADGLKTMASHIRNELSISCVVIHPKESAACATKDETFWIAGPYTEDPKITTGAGDHFNAGFSTAQLLGFPPLACLTMGVSFSGHYVRTGASPSLPHVQILYPELERRLMANPAQGLFITFEGSEGTGKTTQIQRLAAKLESLGRTVMISREPGGTPLGEDIRHLLKHAASGQNMVPRAELLLFAASRAQHVDELIQPNIAKGNIVISDRFLDSSTVYQGVARSIDPDTVETINQIAIADTLPDVTVLIDLDPELGFSRIKSRNEEPPDRMEQEHINFYKAVRAGYLDLAEKNPNRFLIINGGQTIDEVEQAIWDGLKERFN